MVVYAAIAVVVVAFPICEEAAADAQFAAVGARLVFYTWAWAGQGVCVAVLVLVLVFLAGFLSSFLLLS